MGVGEADTVMLSEDAKANPVVSQARITMACFPAGRETIAVRELLVLLAFWVESMYMIIAVTVCSLSSAAALKVTGEVTVAPFVGAQIFTVLSTVDVQVCAAAPLEKARKEKNRVAADNVRREITWGPYAEILGNCLTG